MKKRKLECFMFHDSSAIERHLEKMAAKGWLLTHASNYFWTYEKIEPKKLTFSVTYFSEASDFNPYPTENQMMFLEYCEAAGWKLASEWAKMQIFYTDKINPIPIDTDEALKLQTIQKSMRVQLCGMGLSLFWGILEVGMVIRDIIKSPLRSLTQYTTLFILPLFMCLILFSLNNLISYALWYFKSKRSIHEGGSCYETSKYSRIINKGITIVMILCVVLELISLSMGNNSWIAIDAILIFAVMMSILYGLRYGMKKIHASKTTNIIVSVFLGFILCFVTITLLTDYLVDMHWQDKELRNLYGKPTHDDLPLIVEHMQYIENPDYSYYKEEEETFLVYHLEANQEANGINRSDIPELDYEIVDVKFMPFYDLYLKELMALRPWEDGDPEILRQSWVQTDDKSWQADAVYELYEGDKPSVAPQYIVCWKNRIVRIRFYMWKPDFVQIKVAAEVLSV